MCPPKCLGTPSNPSRLRVKAFEALKQPRWTMENIRTEYWVIDVAWRVG